MDPSFDGTYLSWVTPRLITPLVLHPTKFLDKRITMGVEGRVLDEVTTTSRGYKLLVNSTAVEIRIPFGAVGGYRKNRGVKIIEVRHPNGTKDFVLKVPFNNPLVSVEYIGALIRRYTLNINYTLNIVPQNEPYFHPAAIVYDVKDVNLPDVKSFCTNRSVVFEVTPGNMDSSWELCIGSRPLPYTIAEPKITIELPLFSIGYIYEVRISQGFNNESRASTVWSTGSLYCGTSMPSHAEN
ncbi:UNVERIFIED_CONTAM: hypothetical protein FKN15_005799 [Acipenser sinensis]